MKILDRYIIKEMLGPTALGFGFYTFIILMKNLFDFAEMIIKRSLPLSTVLRLLAWTLPHIVVLTIPMSLLFGILIAVGRLSSDSEVIAMRSSGIATSSIYKPVFYFSFAIFLVNLYLINFILPRGNTLFQNLRSEIATSAFAREIRPRIFLDDIANLVLYVNDLDPSTGEWKGVFLSESEEVQQPVRKGKGSFLAGKPVLPAAKALASPDATTQRIIVASTGRLSTVGPNKQVWVDLQGAETHRFTPRKPERYDLNSNVSQRFLIDKVSDSDRSRRQPRSVRELSVRELLKKLRTQQFLDPIERRSALVEVHKKFSLPFACLAFGIVGLPLGMTNRRGGKSSGFTLSIAIILVYYILINNGEDLALAGKLNAAVAMWAPNVIIALLGVYLIIRASSESGSAERRKIWPWLSARARGGVPKQARVAAAEQSPSLASRLDIPFPNILDRYVIREFLKVLVLVLMSTTVLFMIVDYTEIAGDVSKRNISLAMVGAYYRYFLLKLFSWTLPISILVGTLVTFGLLAKNNEITALKANGVSLYRTAVPVVAIALAATFLSYVLMDFVLPHSNKKYDQLHSRIKGKERPSGFSVQQKQWLFGNGRYMFNFLSYDRPARRLSEVQVFEFAPTEFRLSRRVWANRATFDGQGWVFENGWIRTFDKDGGVSFTPITQPVRLHYRERPDDFAVDVKLPEQMTYRELRRHIENLRSSGYSADELTVNLYQKASWPFICVVMALIALPFAFRIGKRGALYGVGIALFLAFIYWTVFGIFTKFGEVGNLPAMLAAWSANILFALAALYMFLRVET